MHKQIGSVSPKQMQREAMCASPENLLCRNASYHSSFTCDQEIAVSRATARVAPTIHGWELTPNFLGLSATWYWADFSRHGRRWNYCRMLEKLRFHGEATSTAPWKLLPQPSSSLTQSN